MNQVNDIFNFILKNTNCSYCQEYEKIENNEGWNLYMKEYDMYSALLLYHPVMKKDIRVISKPTDIIILLDKDSNVIVKLEIIIQNNETLFSTLVPTEEYQSFYDTINSIEKPFDKTLNALYIGEYTVQIKSS